MSDNILNAINNIISFGNYDLKDYTSMYLIRINAVGEQLEYYIKDSIAGTFKTAQEQKEIEYNKVFSYLGNQNNPPDLIIKNSDAYEIKKIQRSSSAISLNSSPPKNKLLVGDKRITKACKNCEGKEWKEKDLFYVIGNVVNKKIKYLFFIQGICYAADYEVYKKISDPIKESVNEVINSNGFENVKTNELGKVKRVDPLGITDLRIRGMWHIQNPIKVYANICNIIDNNKFHLFVIMGKDKYISYPKTDREKIETNNKISITDVKIKDPNNPAKLIDIKLIIFKER